MKKSILFCLFLIFSVSVGGQIFVPNGTVGTSNNANKVMIGPYIAPINYEAQLFVNTRVGSSNSSQSNLLLNYTLSSYSAPVESTPPSVMRISRYDPYTSTIKDVFDLQPSGKLFLGTTEGASALNISGAMEVLGNRDISLNSGGVLGWKANFSSPSLQTFTIKYMGDGINPAKDLMTFKPAGAINIGGFLNPDANLAIGSDFTPDSRVHIKTWGPTSGGEPTEGVYGLIVENTGWRGHDFAFEVRSAHGPVFSVGNAGHVLIGQQNQNEINKALPDLQLYSLYVARGIRTERIRVDEAAAHGWADYVFDEDYVLLPLEDLKCFINEEGHLPGVPTAEEVAEEGIDLAEMNAILLEKVEELTLYVLKLEEKVNNLETK